MRKKQASSIVYMIFFFAIFLAFCSFAVDGSIILSDRAKLQNATESTALAAASEFNSSSVPSAGDIEQRARDVFAVLSKDRLKYATITPVANATKKQVLVVTQNISRPFFLSFLGVTGITLEAKACATSEVLPVTSGYAGVNWLSASSAYFSDILSKDLNFNDTAILLPLGDFASASYYTDTEYVDFSLINSDDNKPLSLGPGGFVTIKLPAPIVDKPGNDLFIKEIGSLEGYMVFVGLDNNPEKPYEQAGNTGDGISWVNISCSGTSADSIAAADTAAGTNLGAQDKFYGSGYFDIGANCIGGISMAKYLRIIDDNDESGFVKDSSNNYHKVKLYGEASTANSGADIDYVNVLNNVRLIQPSDFVSP